ncbi:MAG: hypothetical protein GF400_09855, partial [Candidatus Eisenbacteria bacterium]|nr:hypothetical protein [Candidatus Eisenbacteria bacterium]
AALCASALAAALSPALAAGEQTTLVYPPFGHCLGLHKVTDFHRFIYLGTRTELDDPAGIAAVKLDSNDDPSTAKDDDELTVFGLNSGRCEIIFNKSIYEASVYGECGAGRGQFRAPLGIAADENGNVYVADTGNDRVARLRYADGSLRWVSSFDLGDGGAPGLRRPSDIDLGASGRVYVCDTGNDRVAIASPSGELVRTIKGDEERALSLSRPAGLAVVEDGDEWFSRRRGFIAVSDLEGKRLSAFDLEGRLLHTVDATVTGSDDAGFGALAIDYYGNVYAVDGEGGRIHKFDRDFRYVTAFGETGNGDGEFDDPRGITLWRRFGQIFVTERDGAQYLWIGTDIENLAAEPDTLDAEAPALELRYDLTETSRVTITLLDEEGEEVAVLVDNRRRRIGPNTERWGGSGRELPPALGPGRYTLAIEARPTYSSGRYFQHTAQIELVVGR